MPYKVEVRAGAYFLAPIFEAFQQLGKTEQQQAKSVAENLLAYYSVEGFVSNKIAAQEPIAAILQVLYNLSQRGLPTRMSWQLEQRFWSMSGSAILQENERELGYIWSGGEDLLQACYNALHTLGLKQHSLYHEKKICPNVLESSFEEEFVQYIGSRSPFWLYTMQPQYPLHLVSAQAENQNKRLDFAWVAPYVEIDDLQKPKSKKGYNIETDGERHKQQINSDHKRDETLKTANWAITRIKSGESISTAFRSWANDFIKDTFWKRALDCFQDEKGWQDAQSKSALHLIWSPALICRLQQTLLRAMLTGVLDWAAPKWRIAVVERDMPAAVWAVDDLRQQILALLTLNETTQKLPDIELCVFGESVWKPTESALQTTLATCTWASLDEAIAEPQKFGSFDLCIDLSAWLPMHLDIDSPALQCPRAWIKLRTAYGLRAERTVLTGEFIEYPPFGEWKTDSKEDKLIFEPQAEKQEALRYFLRLLFRKPDFRRGQLAIMSRAPKSVIGLLPTGGGKSLTYQIAALLQPGIALVVCPLKSLMKDQYDGLRKNYIDFCAFINSSQTKEESLVNVNALTEARLLFFFISPERLQIEDFRTKISAMHEQKRYFSYGVIDEAHCVSEWGHDFRTAYLRVGGNLMQYVKRKNNSQPIPIFALTATASFDVLADVQRELSSPKFPLPNEAIIDFANDVQRKELHYSVYNSDEDKISSIIDIIQNKAPQAFKKTFEEFYAAKSENFYPNAGLIFVPHAGGEKGVKNTFAKLKKLEKFQLGRFHGNKETAEKDKKIENAQLNKFQEQFINSQLQLMVATKAFGMGIDKPNVRFTIHYSYPASLEAFVQEAGRAGRDTQDAHCFIIYPSDKTAQAQDESTLMYFHDNTFKGEESEFAVACELLTTIRHDKKPSTAGIESLLQNMNIGDTAYIDIDYETDNQELKQTICDNLNLRERELFPENKGLIFLPHLVLEEIKNSSKVDVFIHKLNKKFQNNHKNSSIYDFISVSEKIAPFFHSLRKKQDTEKALYRFSLLGIIDDYQVDYADSACRVQFTRRSEEEYTEKLRQYLLRYYSEQRTQAYMEQLPQQEGSSLLQRLLRLMIRFVYSELEKKRHEARNAMRQACEIGKNQKNNQEMKEYILLYFNSKYARQGYSEDGENCSLYDLTEGGRKEAWQELKPFIERTAPKIDNLKHLRGACVRLLASAPNNDFLRLLQIASIFMLEHKRLHSHKRPDSVKDAENQFFTLAKNKKNSPYIEIFRNSICQFFPQLSAYIDPLLFQINAAQIAHKYQQLAQEITTFSLKLNAKNW